RGTARDPALLAGDAVRDRVHDRRGGRARAAQRAHHLHVRRAHAECGEPGIRGVREPPEVPGRPDLRVLRHDCGRGRGGDRARHHRAPVPAPGDRVRGPDPPAQGLRLRVTFPMLWIIPALPLAAVALNLLIGDRLGKRGTTVLACGSVIAAFLLALRAVLHLAGLPEEQRQLTETAWTWMRVEGFTARVSFLLDPLSAVMVLVVTGGGSLIHVYARAYMSPHPPLPPCFLLPD